MNPIPNIATNKEVERINYRFYKKNKKLKQKKQSIRDRKIE